MRLIITRDGTFIDANDCRLVFNVDGETLRDIESMSDSHRGKYAEMFGVRITQSSGHTERWKP